MMKIPCKNVAKASLNNCVLIDEELKRFHHEIAERSNGLIEKEFKDHRDEIIAMNSEMEAVVKAYSDEHGRIRQDEGYVKQMEDLSMRYPKGKEFSEASKDIIKIVSGEDIDLNLDLVSFSDISTTITGEQLNICNLIIVKENLL